MALPKRKIRTGPRRASERDTDYMELGSATLKKTGGSLTITVPASARDALHLIEGMQMNISLAKDQLILKPAARERPKYTLAELLAQCDFDAPYTDEERAWLDAKPVGREIW